MSFMKWILLILAIILVAVLLFINNSGSPVSLISNPPSPTVAIAPLQTKNTTTVSSPEEPLAGPILFEKIMAIQVTADKHHRAYVSSNDTKNKLEKVCDELSGLIPFYYPICEMMLTNSKVGESMSEILADYRYATSPKEKLELRIKLIEIFAQEKQLTLTDDYLDCSSHHLKLKDGIGEEDLSLSFSSLEARASTVHHSMERDSLKVALGEELKELDAKTKRLSQDIYGLFLIHNQERHELQICSYLHPVRTN